MSGLRVGIGVDAHAFSEDAALVVGGVEFPGEAGLAGHSDGDVVAHALVDAILGAAGLGDIGSFFPSDDAEWEGASSLLFLERAVTAVREAGFELVNADCVLIGERPRIAGVRAASKLGLYGFGASARLALQVARHWGCDTFVCTRSTAEQDAAPALGATWAGGYDDRPPAPLDAAITFTPVGDVVVAALRALDRGGTVAINAIHLDRIPELDYEDLWWERSLRSSQT